MVRDRFSLDPAEIADTAAAVFDGVAIQGLAPKAAARHAEAITGSAARE